MVILVPVIQAPMNIVGLVLWRKTSQNKVTIKPRELNLWYKLLVVFVAAGLTAGFYFVFSNDDVRSFIYQNDDSTKGTVDFILDSMILAVTMCAITLLTLKYSDQWYLWIFLDIIYCTMYVIQGHAELTVTWACGLINACYGLYMWKFRSKKTN